jgi:hypothetical protein
MNKAHLLRIVSIQKNPMEHHNSKREKIQEIKPDYDFVAYKHTKRLFD